MNIEIKPGKWRMRNGECAVVEFRTGAQFLYPWMGYRENDGLFLTWTEHGKLMPDDNELDLIEPWTDKPAVNWAAMPAWAKWVAMDHNESWWWFDRKPSELATWWKEDGGYCGRIPTSYCPSFTGNWRESLVERPGA